MKYRPLSDMTLEEIYLCYANDFITIENMAQWYGVSEERLTRQISKGKYLHNKQFKDEAI